ncbi:ATP-grasp domain-containing protein [Micromonospora sp. KC606]|uniref:ATP-grasp domain-containing protein n=1 Tax=Micromonospora sp. KC606 TaxID=2530379 RepID=UPI001405096C|nr:ATP-grasp domain-containing protein [Micromonospora sp. KC606]
MRARLIGLVDHMQAMLDLGVDIHLITVEAPHVSIDPRFASVTQLPRQAPQEEFVAAAVLVAKEQGAAAVITFVEMDIEIAETANAAMGNTWAAVEAAHICRDKLRQRTFLAEHGIPTVWFHPVSDIDTAVAAAAARGLPLILKPTRAAASEYVELIDNPDRLRAALRQIQDVVRDRRAFYYDNAERDWALLEEYLPGQEVTLDGVVLDGEFILGGVHNKRHSTGPYFDEDLYTLPFDKPEHEAELVDIATRIVRGLGMRLCMFNAELRADADGRYRVIEFSIRVSGGHPYRHIKDVYSIDLVRMFVRAACGESVADILVQENHRRPPRMTVCAKVIYANGHVVRNSPGEAMHSPYFRVYFPTARPGTEVVAGARGFDYTGLLSVWMPWQPGQDPAVVHAVATDLATKLDFEVRPSR